MIYTPTIDLEKNPKQFEYFVQVVKACNALNSYRKFGYGGAIRGGKTFITLGILIYLSNRYEGSKWHCIREDFPVLQGTTIPSFEKIIRGSSNWKWNRDRANYFAYNKKDSKIFFKGENRKQDPEFDDFLGLETNGIFWEQLEQISQKAWQIGGSRCGSWYIDNMPPAFTLTTFNPTQKWPKQEIFEKWIRDELPKDFYFQHALPTDNAFVTDDQWKIWGEMDDRYQKQFIEGDWTNFDEKDNRFVYCYSDEKHLGDQEIDIRREVILSFDFNKDPITCSVWQHYDGCIYGIEQIKLGNSNIFELCDYINVHYPRATFTVTGDATGKSSSALVKDNSNYYTVIKSKLNLSITQLKVPGINPPLDENRVLVNAIFYRYPIKLHRTKMKDLIWDIKNVRVDAEGMIIKENRKDPTQQADCLDTCRYFLNTFFGWFLKA
jgi:hypothetical protein